MAKVQGKSSWVEQTPANINYIQEIIKVIPEAKFIHIIRDGRDVAISKRKIGWLTTKSKDPVKQLIAAGVSWEEAIKKGNHAKNILKENYLEIRYEDLILNIENELKKINNFTGLNITIENIQNCSVGALKRMNSAFEKNHKKGLRKDAVFRWKKMLSEKELLMFNSSFYNTLKEKGYFVDKTYNMLSKENIKAIFYKTYYAFLIELKNYLKNYFLT